MAIFRAMSGGAPEDSTTEISANTAAIANNVTANPVAFSRARQAPMNPTTSTLRYHRRSGCPESAVWTMVDHPKANPATKATPTPALYAQAPVFLAIAAYSIPVTKNRRYTRTKAPAVQFQSSTTRDATNGTINSPSATSATRSIVFASWFIRVTFSLTIPTKVSEKIHSANPDSPRLVSCISSSLTDAVHKAAARGRNAD